MLQKADPEWDDFMFKHRDSHWSTFYNACNKIIWADDIEALLQPDIADMGAAGNRKRTLGEGQ